MCKPWTLDKEQKGLDLPPNYISWTDTQIVFIHSLNLKEQLKLGIQ